MEGLSQQQAAGQLGWPLGTLQSRLARGRERLRGRLLRRGLAPATALLAGFLSTEGVNAAIPDALVTSTIRMALQFAAGNAAIAGVASASAAFLTRGVLKTMFLHKLRIAFGATLVVSLTAAGALGWAGQTLPADAPAQFRRADHRTRRFRKFRLDGSRPRVVPRRRTGRRARRRPEVRVEGINALINEPLGDGKPDGKKSLGGSGEMIELGMPAGASKVTGVKIHGSRYGQAQPPKESFLIYFLSKDRKRILHTEMAPYSLFKRGPESLGRGQV